MNFFQNLFGPGFRRDERLEKISQEQNEGILDALTLVMMSDGYFDSEEYKELHQVADFLAWDGDDSLEDFLDAAVRRANERHRDREASRSYCRTISRRLCDTWLREWTFQASVRIASADGEIHPEEHSVLNVMSDEFGMSHDRIRFLTEEAMSDLS